MNKIVVGSLLLVSMATLINANETIENQGYSNGFYIGADGGFLNFGGDSLNVETIRNNKTTNKKTYDNIDSAPIEFKLGYQHYRGNRLEVYFKNNELESDGGDVTVDTYGVNYEFAFSSLSDGSKLMPYISFGVGSGDASSSKLKKIDGSDVFELNLGFGLHYAINDNLYTSFSYVNNTVGFSDIKGENDQSFEFSDTTTNNLKVGLSYKF